MMSVTEGRETVESLMSVTWARLRQSMMSVTEGRETVESLMSVSLPSVTDKGGPGELNVPPELPPPKSVILREDLQR